MCENTNFVLFISGVRGREGCFCWVRSTISHFQKDSYYLLSVVAYKTNENFRNLGPWFGIVGDAGRSCSSRGDGGAAGVSAWPAPDLLVLLLVILVVVIIVRSSTSECPWLFAGTDKEHLNSVLFRPMGEGQAGVGTSCPLQLHSPEYILAPPNSWTL